LGYGGAPPWVYREETAIREASHLSQENGLMKQIKELKEEIMKLQEENKKLKDRIRELEEELERQKRLTTYRQLRTETKMKYPKQVKYT